MNASTRTVPESPTEVRDLALRLGADPVPGARRVALTQTGQMRLDLTSNRWLAFTARQTIAVASCAFDWQARFLPFGLLAVVDALNDGKGRLEATALGFIPVMRAAPGPALTRGELMRYLAELAYAPDAILHNHDLRWRVENAETLHVSAGSGDTAVEVRLSLGPDGRIASIFAADRPRSAKPPILPTPWQGSFSDYRQRDGRWVPFRGEVGWQIEAMATPYWRGHLTGWSQRLTPLQA